MAGLVALRALMPVLRRARPTPAFGPAPPARPDFSSPHPPPPPPPSTRSAIKLAAEQDEPDEMNFVRKHAKQQAAEMGVALRDAATRVFSNSSGSYSSNVNLAVENSSWSDESQLQVRGCWRGAGCEGGALEGVGGGL
jgi:hypothetical protein